MEAEDVSACSFNPNENENEVIQAFTAILAQIQQKKSIFLKIASPVPFYN